MKEEKKNGETADPTRMSMDEQAMAQLLADADAVRRGRGVAVVIDGREWHCRPVCMAQMARMQNLDYDVWYMQQRLKEGVSLRQARRINRGIRKAYAKKAAHRVLGRRLWLVPGLLALTWRRLYRQSEKVSATINCMGMADGTRDFFLANLGTSKQALALSMMQVGVSLAERQERGASAREMLRADASREKGDGK